MLARAYIRAARTYVDPFDRICHGLRSLWPPQLQTRKKSRVSLADLMPLHERATVLYAVLTQC